MTTIIPVEQLKNLWMRIAEINSRIKEVTLELQDLQNTPSNPGIQFVRKDQLFKDGDPEKGVEIKKGDPFVSMDPETSNLYIGGEYIGSTPSDDHSNVVIGPGTPLQ
jgi:hypothetical protein